MNKPQENWILDYINGQKRIVTFKEIDAASYWSTSATRMACYSLANAGKIAQGDRVVINGQALATFMPLSVARKKEIEKIDGLMLSQYWPTKIQLPHGTPRYHRGLIHDEAA